MCVSYQRLNQVNCPFAFLVPLCDNAVHYINTEENYFIAVYMDSGYCQVLVEDKARKRLAFFVLGGKFWWKLSTVGALNSDQKNLEMMMKLQN